MPLAIFLVTVTLFEPCNANEPEARVVISKVNLNLSLRGHTR